ncbi:MAG: ABC-F family ATP-binding cassette domain-containing protein, partial [Lachnospiraceae bacterium]|nr:ABC-F family ATP-binding cassette domain-containing protein [Lachnospiraceae bacterium]
MLLTCQNIQKSFGEKTILDQISFHIEEREKVALIGSNGAGKTTLLRIIRKELEPDDGQVVLAKGASLGYLAQHQDVESGRTIYQELLKEKQYLLDMEEKMRQTELAMKQAEGEALEKLMNAYASLTQQFEQNNGYACQSEVTGVLKGLGFSEEDFHKQIANLSGGQKTRVALGCLLLGKPDVLLLDEPTNHLDMDSIVWLETYLLNYPGAVLIVSHDRYFLDRIVTRVVELEQGKAMTFSGNYTAFSQKKAQVREAQMRAYENQQQEIRHQEEVIAKLKSFNREKSIRRAESR